ncbi:MAG: SCO family protein [Chloroflexi bacterium]|nr:SCO family protein [Chloroflexota bacterium]
MPAGSPSGVLGGADLGGLLRGLLRDPLAQVLTFAAALGLLLSVMGTTMGWRETWQGRVSDGRLLPDAALVDQLDRPVSPAQLRGTPIVMAFLYTSCPDVCPLTAARLRQLVDQLGADATGTRIVAITVDPEHDTPALARAFSARYGMEENWLFLTGTPEQVRPLLAQLDAVPPPVALAEHSGHGTAPGHAQGAVESLAHASSVYVFDRDGTRRLVYGGDFSPSEIVHDLKLLSRGTFSPPVPFGTY